VRREVAFRPSSHGFRFGNRWPHGAPVRLLVAADGSVRHTGGGPVAAFTVVAGLLDDLPGGGATG
jgi:hypothetical protein